MYMYICMYRVNPRIPLIRINAMPAAARRAHRLTHRKIYRDHVYACIYMQIYIYKWYRVTRSLATLAPSPPLCLAPRDNP